MGAGTFSGNLRMVPQGNDTLGLHPYNQTSCPSRDALHRFKDIPSVDVQSTKEGERVGSRERNGPGYRDNLNGNRCIQPIAIRGTGIFSRPGDGLPQSNGITCMVFMYNLVRC